MRIKIWGQPLYLHLGTTIAKSEPNPDRQAEERSRHWKILRLSLESVEDGTPYNGGIGVAVPCTDPAVAKAEAAAKADKETKDTPKEETKDTPKEEKSEDTPVSETTVVTDDDKQAE